MSTWTQQWVALVTIMRKEAVRFIRIWPQTLLPPAITMTLYFVIFGKMIGRHIGPMAGLDYASFIAPGLVMMSLITNAYSNVASSFFSMRYQRCIEEILSAPVNYSTMILGYISGGIFRGLICGTVVFLISTPFASFDLHHIGVMITIAILTATLFSLAGFLNGLYAKGFDDIAIIPTFILTPMIYLGGVFYSIQTLSPFWKKLCMFNPILYVINAFRYGMLGVSDFNITYSLLAVAAFVILLFFVCLTLLRRGFGIRT